MSIKRVLVTGATGRTGSLVVQKLQQRPNDFEAIAFARSEAKAKALFDTTNGFFFGDINQSSTLNAAFSGVQGEMFGKEISWVNRRENRCEVLHYFFSVTADKTKISIIRDRSPAVLPRS